MSSFKQYLALPAPILAFILELTPYGAALYFAPSPTERVRYTYSFFDLTPWGYANFFPFLTALLTCAVLLLSLWVAIRKTGAPLKAIAVLSGVAAVMSLLPIIYGVEYVTWIGVTVSLLMIAELVLSVRSLKHQD